MKAVSLTERIKYMHCEGEEGTHGILILLGTEHLPTKAVEIETKADFRRFYESFVATEKAQADLLNHRANLVTV